jgi:hypothetical protein
LSDTVKKQTGWKAKLTHELTRYWFNFLYLAFFLGAFTWYRRLVLAEYHIHYLHYGIALIEALVLAKVILLVDAMHVGQRRGEGKPLIIPVFYKAVVFTFWVGVFGILEHMIEGVFRGDGLMGGFREFVDVGKDELLARCLVTFFAFIPFFAFEELGKILGEGKIRKLFLHRGEGARSEADSGSDAGHAWGGARS